MARTTKAERHRRRDSALALVSQGKGFSDVVTAQMSQWGCSRSSAQWDCRWAHDQLQLDIDSHDAQHLVCYMATSLQRRRSSPRCWGRPTPMLFECRCSSIWCGRRVRTPLPRSVSISCGRPPRWWIRLFRRRGSSTSPRRASAPS